MPALQLLGSLLIYSVIGTAYGRFFYLRHREKPEYLNRIPPAALIGGCWPISMPIHIAFSFGGFIYEKTTWIR